MPNEFGELLKGQEVLGTMDNMSGMTSNKVLHMIFIVDISGSMAGDCIRSVNTAFHQMVPELQEIQREVGDAFELYISILKFGSSASWAVTPTPILDYVHEDLVADGGGTDFKNAFEKLESKLSRNQFMKHQGKMAEPYILFMTDGYPNGDDYKSVLNDLSGNGWYAIAQRYAVLIGKDAINNLEARKAVEMFASDEKEGVINAREAVDIVSVVSAKTIHTIKIRTTRKPGVGTGDEVTKDSIYTHSTPSVTPDFAQNTVERNTTGQDKPFDDVWEDPSSLYGGKFNF